MNFKQLDKEHQRTLVMNILCLQDLAQIIAPTVEVPPDVLTNVLLGKCATEIDNYSDYQIQLMMEALERFHNRAVLVKQESNQTVNTTQEN